MGTLSQGTLKASKSVDLILGLIPVPRVFGRQGHMEYFICNVDDLEDGEDSPVCLCIYIYLYIYIILCAYPVANRSRHTFFVLFTGNDTGQMILVSTADSRLVLK